MYSLFVSLNVFLVFLFGGVPCESMCLGWFKQHCRSRSIRWALPKNRSLRQRHITSISVKGRRGKMRRITAPHRLMQRCYICYVSRLPFALRATRDSSRRRRHNNITKVTRITARDASRKSSDVNFRDERVRSWEIRVLRLSCLFGNLYLSSLCQRHAEKLGPRASR